MNYTGTPYSIMSPGMHKNRRLTSVTDQDMINQGSPDDRSGGSYCASDAFGTDSPACKKPVSRPIFFAEHVGTPITELQQLTTIVGDTTLSKNTPN